MNLINKEHIIGTLCIILGTVVLILTKSFPKGAASNMQLTGPAFFPNLLSVILIIIGVYEIIIGFVSKETQPYYSFTQLWRNIRQPKSITILVIIGMLIFFLAFINLLGFYAISLIFLLVVLWRLNIVWWKNLISSFVFLGIIYLIFGKLFTITLPSGILF